MSFRQFLTEREKGFGGPAYLLTGTDPYFLAEAERMIRDGIAPDRRDFSLDVFDLDAAADRPALLRGLVESLNTFSFFAEKKAVIARHVQKLKQKELEAITAYLGNPSESSTLFLLYQDTLKPNKKASFAGAKIISLDHTPKELRDWAASFSRDLGITLSGEVADFLFLIFGGDAGLLASEMTKLSLLGKKKIEMRDAADVLSGEAGVETFDFTRALAAGNRRQAFSLARSLKDADVSMLLGAINWQLSRRKEYGSGEELRERCRVLLEADIVNKSTGSNYPLELLIKKLPGRK